MASKRMPPQSPTTHAASSSSSTTMTSELEQRLRQQQLQQQQRRRPSRQEAELMPDPGVLFELESQARGIACSIDMALRDLRGSLRGMSDLTCESAQVFGSVVSTTCDSVDAAIRSTYAMLAKAEEFSESVRGLDNLLQQIREVKRLLDMFEAQLQDGGGDGSSPVVPVPAPP